MTSNDQIWDWYAESVVVPKDESGLGPIGGSYLQRPTFITSHLDEEMPGQYPQLPLLAEAHDQLSDLSSTRGRTGSVSVFTLPAVNS
ncbi:hypothetical protein E4U11_001723 [Claviceps purpurea]|nr:hypothetical protein E4U11_001723 [Claviceps purpurea]